MKYIEERDGVGEKSVCCVIKVGAEVYPWPKVAYAFVQRD
jgi:hypothetical protein